jgi:Ca2+/Na+ antiporter
MMLAIAALIVGLVLLVWSADRFVEGSASTARHFAMPPLLIGMVIVGFGTSAPEMLVSALASIEGNAGIALGNAYGSNICNIALILGVSALISPIMVHSAVLRKELPILILVTILTVGLLADLDLSRLDAIVLLLVFAGLMAWTIIQGLKRKTDTLAKEVESETAEKEMPITPSFLSDNPPHANGLALFFPMTRQSRSARIFLYEKSAVWHRREKDTVLRSGTVATCTRSSAQYLPALFQDDAEKCRCGHPNSTAGSVYSPNCQRLTFPFQSAVTMKRPSSVS